MSAERPRGAWPPSRRWFATTGAMMVLAAGGGIALGLIVRHADDEPARAPTLAPLSEKTTSATMTGASFTAGRIGVACQAAAKVLNCSRAGAGRATLDVSGKVKIDRDGAPIPGGPALAPGQTWEAIGIRCTETRGGLECLLENGGAGFFVDADGFVER